MSTTHWIVWGRGRRTGRMVFKEFQTKVCAVQSYEASDLATAWAERSGYTDVQITALKPPEGYNPRRITMIIDAVKKTLREARDSCGLTDKQLAAQLGRSESEVNMALSPRTERVPSSCYRQIANLVGVNYNELVGQLMRDDIVNNR